MNLYSVAVAVYLYLYGTHAVRIICICACIYCVQQERKWFSDQFRSHAVLYRLLLPQTSVMCAKSSWQG